MDKNRILGATRSFVYNAMSDNDPAHDTLHTQRVVALAMQLQRQYPQADSFRTEMLALLHDMNDDKLNSNLGVSGVESFLLRQGLPREEIAFLTEAMDYISFRKHPRLPEAVPLEIRIVQDADRIDAMGAVGVARTFAYGGANNRPLYGVEASSLAHFDEKLLLLYDLLSTDAGRELAKPRQEFLKAFYDQFQKEIQ